MRTIGLEELKQKLDRQDPFRLVMALGEWAYQGSAHRTLKSVRSAREHVHQMYSFGFSGGLRARRFSLKRTLSPEVLQRARCIMDAHLALQATFFA